MRAVLVGLVGAVLAVGAAQAQECRLDAPMVAASRAQWSSDLKRPDLVGKTFRVEKVASEGKAGHGSLSLIVETGGERFLIVRKVDLPRDFTDSFALSDPAAQRVAWGKRSHGAEADPDLAPGFVLDTGPLQSLSLNPKC